jgi:hypothetical protein
MMGSGDDENEDYWGIIQFDTEEEEKARVY